MGVAVPTEASLFGRCRLDGYQDITTPMKECEEYTKMLWETFRNQHQVSGSCMRWKAMSILCRLRGRKMHCGHGHGYMRGQETQ